jgi:steroid delta-isomerase-like uncharacterized protein
MTGTDTDRIAARLKLVDEHVRHENNHNLEAIMGTFGATARYDDEPWDAHHVGRDAVRAFYEGMLQALPGLRIDVLHTHASDTAVVLEVIIRGQHLGPWRGLPATGAQIEFRLRDLTFDEMPSAWQASGSTTTGQRCSGNWGLSRTGPRAGRITTLLMHPLTMVQILCDNPSGVDSHPPAAAIHAPQS